MSFDDPDFWQKVLNDSSSRRLLARLNDGSATASEAAMEEFMSDLQAAVEGIAVRLEKGVRQQKGIFSYALFISGRRRS